MSKARRPPYKPKNVNGQLALRTEFYRQQLYKVVKGMFKLTCSLDWDSEYLRNVLLLEEGKIVITDTVAGVLPVRASLTGITYTGAPSEAIIALPILGDFTRTIGIDCEVLYLERFATGTFYTFRKIVQVFAEKLASADCSIDVNLMNSRLGYIIEAENKAQAETIKETFDRITEGEPLVVYRKDVLKTDGIQAFFGNVKQQYVAGDVQDTKRTIMCEFLTAIGINNANTDKKERLITSEANSNNIELCANVSLWKYNIDRCVKRIKRMFPDLEFDFKLEFDPSNLDIGGIMNDIQGSHPDMGNKKSG